MKNVLFISTVIMLFAACTQDPPSTPTVTPSFKFTANGVQYVWTGSLFDNATLGSKIEGANTAFLCSTFNRRYTITAKGGAAGSCYLRIGSTGPDLKPGVYQSTIVTTGCSSSQTEWNLTQQNIDGYPDTGLGDTFSTTITAVSNGYVSGTFTGVIRNRANVNNITPVTITGEFENVKYIQ